MENSDGAIYPATASLVMAGIALFGVVLLHILFDLLTLRGYCFFIFFVSLLCSIVAFLLGIVSFTSSDKGSRTRSYATFGIAFGIFVWLGLFIAIGRLPWGI
jgi:hypothetical protein